MIDHQNRMTIVEQLAFLLWYHSIQLKQYMYWIDQFDILIAALAYSNARHFPQLYNPNYPKYYSKLITNNQ